jgi:ABC-type dipeptide/oligopeptide/nickel transport system ATPase component
MYQGKLDNEIVYPHKLYVEETFSKIIEPEPKLTFKEFPNNLVSIKRQTMMETKSMHIIINKPLIYSLFFPKEPIKIKINIDSWKEALNYNEEKSNEVFKNLIESVNIEADQPSIEWLKAELINEIKSYEKKYMVKLSDKMRKRLSVALAKMTFDRFHAENIS